jgi:hypothetical protein
MNDENKRGKAILARYGVADAMLRVMACRYRAKSHLALDRLHALDAEIFKARDVPK